MFEKTIQKLIEEISGKADFSGKKKVESIISESGLPEWFAKYLRAEVDWWIYREKIVISSSHHFEVPEDEMNGCFDNLKPLYSENASISKAEYDKITDIAVKLRINYLSRPRTTLLWTIFRNEPTRKKEEILQRLEFFSEYDYLLNSIKEQIGSKYPGTSGNLVSLREFSEIIGLADENHLFQLTPGEFIELLDPLFDNLGAPDESGEIALPVEAVLIFLDDKGINPVIDYLLKSIDGNNIFSITRTGLKEILYNLITETEPREELSISENIGEEDYDGSSDYGIEYRIDVKADDNTISIEELDDEPEPELRDDETEVYESEESNNEIKENPFAKPQMGEDIEDIDGFEIRKTYQPYDLMKDELDQDDVSLPLPKVNDEESIPENEELPLIDTDSIEIIADSSSDDFYDLDIVLSGTDRKGDLPDGDEGGKFDIIEEELKTENFPASDADINDGKDKKETETLNTIANLIDEKTESRFVKKIFNYDLANYNKLLDILDSCTDWKDAATKIDIFFAEHSIDPLSGTSEEFRELIKKRYN
jgi:hypothetical protein